MPLTDMEREMLELERKWWQHPGAKVNEVRERFGLSETQYYQQLNSLLSREDALAFDPVTVRRLQRLRDRRVS